MYKNRPAGDSALKGGRIQNPYAHVTWCDTITNVNGGRGCSFQKITCHVGTVLTVPCEIGEY